MSLMDACLLSPMSAVKKQLFPCVCSLHNLYLDFNVPMIKELVCDVMEPEVMNNTPVQGATFNKRQQLFELFHKKCFKLILLM
ncbi:hypothetical protein DPMN_167371 [Dreissena polymorpha]|uniref:Uncharacterized protein n=1 Tax=Dreissena polymorpha TaxID=45954 RepID=A0A9D4IYQ8_DREPO|nr:hypothetical protein DPMN_167371 [Dreissena polymorpha]